MRVSDTNDLGCFTKSRFQRKKSREKNIHKLQKLSVFTSNTPSTIQKRGYKTTSMMFSLSERVVLSDFDVSGALLPTTRALPMRPDPPDRRRPVRAHKPGALSEAISSIWHARPPDQTAGYHGAPRPTNEFISQKDKKTGGRPPTGAASHELANLRAVHVHGHPSSRLSQMCLRRRAKPPTCQTDSPHRRIRQRHRRCPPCASLGTWQLHVWASARARKGHDGHFVPTNWRSPPTQTNALSPARTSPVALA